MADERVAENLLDNWETKELIKLIPRPLKFSSVARREMLIKINQFTDNQFTRYQRSTLNRSIAKREKNNPTSEKLIELNLLRSSFENETIFSLK